jgi:hypothetical protein
MRIPRLVLATVLAVIGGGAAACSSSTLAPEGLCPGPLSENQGTRLLPDYSGSPNDPGAPDPNEKDDSCNDVIITVDSTGAWR